MTGPGCTRKHTPIVSERQERFVRSVQSVQQGIASARARKSAKVQAAARSWPSKGVKSPAAHLTEIEHKNLPERAARKGLHRLAGR